VNLIERRIGLLFAMFVLAFVVIVARAAWLQGVEGSALSADAKGQQTETVEVPGSRGEILDRNREPLAISEDAATIYATPYQVEDPERTASKLAGVLDQDENDILRALADRESGFAYIARKVDLPTAERIKQMGLPGIGELPDSRRVYPQGELASQVIGSVGTDNEGLTGLEASEEDTLQGTTGEREIVHDALGKEIERDTLQTPEAGSNLRLTIDANIQGRVEDVLAGLAQTYRPAGASAIVMNPQTSEVLALANYPSSDPSHPENATDQELMNRATGYVYEPGSTFKAFTVAGALEDKVVTPTTPFNLPVELQVADRTITDAHERGPETLTVSQIIQQSSNVGAALIGLRLNEEKGDDRFDHWVRRFGFGRPTGIDFPGEEQGIVLHPDEYSGSTMGNLPIGQGLAVTPIQMATAYSAIANGGILRAPRVILNEDGEKIPEPEGHRVISSKTAAELREMLEGVLAPGGTASEVSVPGYTLAGKTGTAEKVVDGKYSDYLFDASFVGFAPADNPQLLVAVVVDEPKGDYYGGTVAAPAFGEIAKFALPYLGIEPDQGQG
jgi:cell division protein FtsI (penicillin-binding protein 3)